MANQNFRVKKGLEVGVGATVVFADGNGIGINNNTPQTGNVDVNKHVRLQQTLEAVGFATFTGDVLIDSDLTVTGIASYIQLDAEQSQIGVLTARSSYLGFTTIGVASVGFATVTDIVVGNGTYTGINTFTGTIFADDLSIAGVVTASEGNFIFTNLQGETILFTGVGTIAQLGVNTFSADLSTLGIVGIETSLDVNGITTLGTSDPVAGFVTTRGDLYVGGDLFVLDDIKYDEISGRNLDIAGIATIGTLGVTTDVSVGRDLDVTDDVFIGRDLDVVGIATVGVLSTAEARIDDAAIGVATIARYLNVAGVTTLAGIVTTGDDTYVGKDLYVAGDLDLSGDIRLEDIFARNLVVSGVATFTSGITTFLDAENINAGVSTIGIASVGFATVTDGYTGVSTVNDIYVENLLYDSNSNVGLADSILATAGGKLVWTRPDLVGVATGFDPGNTIYVTTTGDDNNSGISREKPVLTIEQALTLATSGTIIEIAAGNYVENFPLTVPAGVTIKGAGQRATYVSPATTGVDGFLMNDASTVEQLTIGGFLKNGAENYTFKYETGAAITTRSPYVSQVTVLNKGSKTSPTDLYGYTSNDNPTLEYRSANGVLADGSVLDASTTIPGFLVNEVTIFAPAARGIVMTNGARVEMVASFIYFAEAGIVGETDLAQGLSGSGRTRLSLENASTTPSVGNTLQYFDSDGSTILASGTIDEVSGGYVYLNGSGTGEFKVPRNRQPKRVNFVDSSALNTAIKKFGTASLDCTVSNTSGITVDSSADFGFGTGDFTVEFWLYRTSNLNNTVLFDLRDTSDTDSAISIHGNGGDALSVYIGNTLTISGSTAVALNTWTQVAVSRQGTSLRLFIEGSLDASATSSDDLGTARPLHLGDSYAESSSGAALYDELRITKGAAKYTSNFTPSSVALKSDENTSILLHFDGTNGATETTDDVLTYQDIRFNGNTADRISLSDYSEFGCDLRSVSSAVEYGNRGVVGEGAGAQMRLISLNFNHVGALGDITNDFRDANKSNEVVNVDGAAKIAYVSIDELGDFRVGDAFYVNQATGQVSFDKTTNDLTSLTSLTITDGVNNSVITPTSGRFGQVLISGNTVESVSGDINIAAAGGSDINLIGDTNVTGILTASTIRADALQNFDTFIALDDSGVNDGTIRLATDNVEGMRLDNQQRVGIKTQTVRADLDVVGQTQLEKLEVTGVTTTTHLAVGVAATIGFATITDAYIGVATFSDVDINDVGVGVATISYADITDALVGVSTIGFATITDGYVAIATITDANIGVATIAYSDTTDAQAGVLTVTGISTFKGESVFENNVLIDGDLTITGSQNSKSFGAEFLSVTGIATIAFSTTTDAYIGVVTIGYADVSDAAVAIATITEAQITDSAIGVATIGYADITDAAVAIATVTEAIITDTTIGVATVGFATLGNAAVGGGLTVYGDLDVIGDISYDEVSGRNLSISGIATIGDLEVERDLDVGQNLDVVGIATVGVLSTSSALIGIATVGVVTAKDGFFETLTFGSSGGGGGGGGGGTGINSESVRTGNLYVSGIATINTGIVTDLTVEIATIEDAQVGASTITYANVTDLNVSGVATVGLQTVTTDLYVGDELSVIGLSSFYSDLYVDGNINVTGSQNVESFGAVNLEVTGIATIADARIEDATIAFADVTDSQVAIATITEAIITETTITDAGVGVATIGYADITDAAVAIATVTEAVITDAGVGVATIGYADITDAQVAIATITEAVITDAGVGVATIGYGNIIESTLGISTIAEADITDANIGVATVGYSDLTDALIGVATVGFVTATELSVGAGLTVYGDLDVKGDISYDEVTGRNLNITGVGTIRNFVSTAATIAYADIQDAEVGVASVGLASITTADVTTLTAYSLTVPDGGIVSLPGIPILGGDATFNNLNVGAALTVGAAATFNSDVRVEGNLFVSGIQINSALGAEDLLVTGIATIAAGIVTNLQSSVGTITDLVSTASTITFADIDLADIADAAIGVATVAYVNATDINVSSAATVGFATITSAYIEDAEVGFATITDGFVGFLTVTNARIVKDLTIEGELTINEDITIVGVATAKRFVSETATVGVATLGIVGIETSLLVSGVTTTTDLAVTGVATVGFATLTDAAVGGGLTVYGDLDVKGDISYDEVTGRNLSISGVGTIADLKADTAVVGHGTITDFVSTASTIAYANITDAEVGVGTVSLLDFASASGLALTVTDLVVTGNSSLDGAGIGTVNESGDFDELGVVGLSTFGGDATFYSNVTVEGNLDVTGDITYDEISGRRLNITGISTLNDLQVNGFTTFTKAIGTALTVTDLVVSGIATLNGAGIATEGGDVNFEGIEVGVITATTGDFTYIDAVDVNVSGAATIGLASVTTAGVGTITAFDGTFQNLTVPDGGVVSLPGIPVAEGDATFRNLDITGISSFTGVATYRGDVYIEGTLFTSGDVVQDSVSADNATFGTVGINTGLAVTGYSTFTSATITGVTTITELADLNVSGLSTVGFITARDVWVSGMITAQDVNSLSDRRVKENIRNIEKPLEKIDRINGVKFDFINSGKKSMGVIAQEVEQVFPELISGEFPKSVNYNGLIGLLIESVKELKQQNETMQAEIERLKNK